MSGHDFRCWLRGIIAAVFVTFFSLPAPALASQPDQRPGEEARHGTVLETKTLTRIYDPVEIRAEILQGLSGIPLSELALYSSSNGSFHRVPFQFDEWTDQGSMVLDRGSAANAEQGNGVLDPNDMLVFMARDTGDRISKQGWPEGKDRGLELEVLDPLTNEKGWAYLFQSSARGPEEGAPPPLTRVNDSDVYIAQGVTYTIVGTNHVIGDKTYKTVINEHIWVNKAAGGDGKDFIDRSKFRVSARLLFGTIHIGFDEDNFIGEVSKYKIGPVRSIARQWGSIVMPLGLKSPKFYGDVYVYDTMVLIIIETKVSINPKYFLTDYRLIQGYDLRPDTAFGMRWYNSNNPDGFLVDGITSPEEAHMNDTPDQWRCIVGPNGWMLHRSTWDDFYRSQAEITVHYRDDIQHKDPPENDPGDLGYYYVESKVKSLKPRIYTFQLEWYWPYDFYDNETLNLDVIKQVMNIRDHPLRVRAGGHEVESSGGKASLVEP